MNAYCKLIDAAQEVLSLTQGLKLPDDVNAALDRLYDAVVLDAGERSESQ